MVSIQEEKFAPFFRDAQELFPQHHKELAVNQDKIRMDLDWQQYQKLEDAGRLFVLTARDEGRVIGYLVAFPMPNHLHYKSAGPIALTDMFWVMPEYRRGTGTKLFTEFERRMKERGCVMIMTGCKMHQPHHKLFNALGWVNTDATFVKCLI